MTTDHELETDKSRLVFAAMLSDEDQAYRESVIARIQAVKTRVQFDYLLAELTVETADE